MTETFPKPDLEKPTANPCCMDECLATPTYEIQIALEDAVVGQVFICEPHYEGLKNFKEIAMRNSKVLRNMLMKGDVR